MFMPPCQSSAVNFDISLCLPSWWYFDSVPESIFYFSSIKNAVEVTGTFKQMKAKLVEESFDPGRIQDPLYILNENEKTYIPLTAQVYDSIISGNIKLWVGADAFHSGCFFTFK